MDFKKKAKKCAKKVLSSCLNMKKNEMLLVVFDRAGFDLADAFSNVAEDIHYNVCFKYVSYSEQKASSKRNDFLNDIVKCIKCSDAILFSGSSSGECSRFRIKLVNAAVAEGLKVIHMPGVDEETFIKSTHNLNFQDLHQQCEKYISFFNENDVITITTKDSNGKIHKLSVNTNGRYGHMSGGIAQKSEILNLPTGEVFTAPNEKSANGTIVLNGAAPDCVFSYENSVTLSFNSGIVSMKESSFPQEKNCQRLKEQLQTLQKVNVDNVTLGEFGIGLNPLAPDLTGNSILDEKAYGTAHIALGTNKPFGGILDCGFHTDLIFIPHKINFGKAEFPRIWKKA